MTSRLKSAVSTWMVAGALLLAFGPAQAYDDQAEMDAAVRQAQDLMNNPAARQKAVQESPEAIKADAYAGSISPNPQHKEEMYKISGEIMKHYMSDQKKGSKDFAEMLSEAQRDPSAFLESLPPEYRAKIKALAEDIEKQKGSAAKP